MDMAAIGATAKGGSCRVALTDEDKAGRDLFRQWCEDAGCEVSIDDIGNMFARRPGADNALAPVMAGSHLDTQPHGGKFDGVYGVLAGLEVVRALNDHNIKTKAPVEVVVWTNEEGARFSPAMVASGVFAGLFTKDFALNLKDADGLTFGDELQRIGYAGTESCGDHPVGALFEAHIEQGPVLERNENVIGVVTGGQGQRWFDISLSGQDSHAGSTPMQGRRDALVAASRVISEIQAIALKRAPHGVGTVGNLTVSPNSRNTIPGSVVFSVDLRHPEPEPLATMAQELRDSCQRSGDAEGVTVEVNEIWDKPPVVFNDELVQAVRDGADRYGYKHQDIVSGAGHDACQVCLVAPTAMIFVPCADGLSHNEEESAEPQDLEAGCNVLLHAMLASAVSV